MNAFGRVDGIRLRLIGLALFSALPLVALGVLRLATGSLHDRNMLASDAERAASVAAARIDERIRAADALLLGLSNTLVADPARRVENEAILLRTLEGTASPIVNLFLLDSIGTLVAFSVVALGVLVLRRTHADLDRPFRIPGYPVTPLLTIAACVWILIGLPMTTWVIFLAWLAIVMAFYLAYGRRNATLNTYVDPEEIAEPRGKEDQ